MVRAPVGDRRRGGDRRAGRRELWGGPDDDGRGVRTGPRPDRAAAGHPVELFYDLVFVFILARLAEALLTDLRPLGAYRTLLLLLAVWWIWSYTNLVTETLDSRQPVVQMLIITIMLGSLVVATAIPEAFAGRGYIFAAGYVGIHLLRSGVLAVFLRRHQLRNRPLRGIFWFGLSGVLWLAGAGLDGGARILLWTVALGMDYLLPLARWPTPRIGRSPDWEWGSIGEHLAERYRQFVIIALGETVVVTARAFHQHEYDLNRLGAFGISFTITVLLWWVYFYRPRERLGAAITGSADPARETTWAGYAHLIMVAGVVVTTAGDELFVTHPFGDSHPSWVAAIVGGPTLFLAGRALLGHEVFVHVARPWLVGIGVLVVMAPAMVFLPLLAVAGCVALVLLGVVVADTIGVFVQRPEGRSPT